MIDLNWQTNIVAPILDPATSVLTPQSGNWIHDVLPTGDATSYYLEWGATAAAMSGSTVTAGNMPYQEAATSDEVRYYRVSRVSAGGQRGYPSPVVNATAPDIDAPDAPTSIVPTTVDNNTARLTWVNDTVGDYAGTRIDVYDGPGGSLVETIDVTAPTVTRDIDLPPNSGYVATLRGYDEVPNYGPISAEISIPPAASTEPTATVTLVPAESGTQGVLDIADLNQQDFTGVVRCAWFIGMDAPTGKVTDWLPAGSLEGTYAGEELGVSTNATTPINHTPDGVGDTEFWCLLTVDDELYESFTFTATVSVSAPASGPTPSGTLKMDVTLAMNTGELWLTDNLAGAGANVFDGTSEGSDQYSYAGITVAIHGFQDAGIRATGATFGDNLENECDALQIAALGGSSFIDEDFSGGSGGDTLASGSFGTWSGESSNFQKNNTPASHLRLNGSGYRQAYLSGGDAVNVDDIYIKYAWIFHAAAGINHMGPMFRVDTSNNRQLFFYYNPSGTRWYLIYEDGDNNYTNLAHITGEGASDTEVHTWEFSVEDISATETRIKIYLLSVV